MSQTYSVSSEAYLFRASALLDSGEAESLFYAAFELRAGIEARLREYVEHQLHVPKKKRSEWNLNNLGRTAKDTFKLGDKYARYTFYEEGSSRVVAKLHYVPITTRVQREAGRLGDYLHALESTRDPSDPWWAQFRDRLAFVRQHLWEANQGSLLGAPLKGPDGKIRMPFVVDSETWSKLQDFKKGDKLSFNVEYLDTFPDELRGGV